MDSGAQKRKNRNCNSLELAKPECVENSDLEPGEIARETDSEMEESIEGGVVSKTGDAMELEREPLMADSSISPVPRRHRRSKKHRIESERHRISSERDAIRNRRHSSNRRSEIDRSSALTFRERERLRKRDDPSPRRRRSSDFRVDSNRRHHSKRRRRHREKNRDRDDEIEIEEPQIDESELIERQREERRKRIEAIKSKHRQLAQQRNQPPDLTVAESDGGSDKSTSVVQPHVNENADSPGGTLSPNSVSSVELTLVNRKSEDANHLMEQVSSVLCQTQTESQLKANTELVIDKPIQTLEKDECSTDHLAMLKDEKHDKEKLLVDTRAPSLEAEIQETDDIFCDSPEAANKAYSALDNAVKKATANRGLIDAYDDAEGYYKFRIGEILDNRYEIASCNGKGVFSTVLRGKDKVRKDANGEYPEVCVKVIRANDLMKNCGRKEEHFLKQLAATDPDNKRHCIRLLRSFFYRGHLCLVFEPMSMNLRELTKKFGRDVGLSLDGVGHFTAQLLVALKHLKMNKILHADIKPDNILVNEKFSRVKLCDFGSAMEDWSTEITPYVCSRFYRPPEVILGLEYSYGMDMWSLGCVIYEMFTGQYLFPGRSNNAMLKLMMDVKGPFPKKLLKKATFCEEHFEKDINMSFIEIDLDKFTKKPVKKLVSNPSIKQNFQSLLSKYSGGCDHRLVVQLADLLEKMMMLDPDKRIDVDEAMRHPFVKTYLHKAKHAQQQKEQQEQAAQQKQALK
eukprot:g3870.t1